MKSNVFRGMVWSVVLAFPLAALSALVFRFPIPFAGYESGIPAVPRALLAVIFYGFLGGFPVLAGAGALSGVLASKLAGQNPERSRRLTAIFAAAAAGIVVFLLAILDQIIGPW